MAMRTEVEVLMQQVRSRRGCSWAACRAHCCSEQPPMLVLTGITDGRVSRQNGAQLAHSHDS